MASENFTLSAVPALRRRWVYAKCRPGLCLPAIFNEIDYMNGSIAW